MKQTNQGPFIPEDDLLRIGAPLDIWRKARKECLRSPMLRFKVGAVIFDNNGALSSGCSNPDVSKCKNICSIHAEHHALKNGGHLDLEGAWIAIYTLGSSGGCAWSSRPCYSCASLLYKRGIDRVIYPERKKDNSWNIISIHPEELLVNSSLPSGGFAKHQRTEMGSFERLSLH